MVHCHALRKVLVMTINATCAFALNNPKNYFLSGKYGVGLNQD